MPGGGQRERRGCGALCLYHVPCHKGFGTTQNIGLLTFAFLTPFLCGEGTGSGELLWDPEIQYCPQAAQTSVLLGRAGDYRGAQGLTTPTPIAVT